MSDKIKAADLVPELRDAFARVLAQALAGTPAHHALQAADAVCDVMLNHLRGLLIDGGPVRQIDHAAIADDWRRGLNADQIAARHGCSRSTAYEHHPHHFGRAE